MVSELLEKIAPVLLAGGMFAAMFFFMPKPEVSPVKITSITIT